MNHFSCDTLHMCARVAGARIVEAIMGFEFNDFDEFWAVYRKALFQAIQAPTKPADNVVDENASGVGTGAGGDYNGR